MGADRGAENIVGTRRQTNIGANTMFPWVVTPRRAVGNTHTLILKLRFVGQGKGEEHIFS